MTKYITTYDVFEETKSYADGFIIGIKDLTVNFSGIYEIEEAMTIIQKLKEEQKEVFVALNKNMHEEDLKCLEDTMKTLDSLNITGILYYDIALVTIKMENQLKTPLVWAQEHLTTNYMTCNYWHQFGADYAYLSGEITMDEIIEIKENTEVKVMVPIFGRLPMFVSKRHLVQNYLHYFNIKTDTENFQIEKEGKRYPIMDDKQGTVVFSSYYLNGLSESLILKKHHIDYFYLNFNGVKKDLIPTIMKNYVEADDENKGEYEKVIDELLEGNTDKGFLYKETVYKVK